MSTERCRVILCPIADFCEAKPEGVVGNNVMIHIECRHNTCPLGMREARRVLRGDKKKKKTIILKGKTEEGYPFGTNDHKPYGLCGRLVAKDGTIFTQGLGGEYYQSPQRAFGKRVRVKRRR